MIEQLTQLKEKIKTMVKLFIKKLKGPEPIDGSQSRRGIVHQDKFLDYIKGYTPLKESSYNASDCFIEVRNVSEGTFELLNDSENFSIEYPSNATIEEDLNNYFIERRFVGHRELYPNYSLGAFLTQIVRSLIVLGKTFYELSWETKTVTGDREYILPTDFHYLSTSTMSVKHKKGKVVKFVQKFSWFTYLFSKEFRGYENVRAERKTTFAPDKILYFEYFEKRTPVQKALQFMKNSKRFNLYSLDLSKANAYPEDKSLSLSRARGRSIKKTLEEHYLNQALIRKQFHYFIEGSQFDYYSSKGLKTTQYYDIFLVIRYLKYKNRLRSHVVNTFNDQILKRVAEKNDLPETPKLVCNGYASDEELDQQFEKYKSGEIFHKGFVEYLREQKI